MIGILKNMIEIVTNDEAQRVGGVIDQYLTPERVMCSALSPDATSALALVGIWRELRKHRPVVITSDKPSSGKSILDMTDEELLELLRKAVP